jgi:hypothetical protein
MTEIDDLSQLFQPRPQFTPEQQAHVERVQEFEKQLMLERIEAVMFLAPILCTCRPAYKWGSRMPPQAKCPIHGMLMAHPYTGELIMPGVPVPPGMFTPGDNDEGDSDE